MVSAALALVAAATPAHALSSACAALNSNSGTTSYNTSFAGSAFAAGETFTYSYTDDGGDTATVPIFATDHVLVEDENYGTAWGEIHYSSDGVAGLHGKTIASSDLMADGLRLFIQTGTHIGPVTLTCAGLAVAPTVAATSTTIAANSSGNAVNLAITGTATAVEVASAPSHGTATASGTSITYTPNTGYAGADSFTYTARNASGTSTAATATITVTAPTFVFSPAAGALPGATYRTAYSQSLSTTGGTASYSYSVTGGSLPAGLTLGSGGILSGTPTAAGTSSFSVTATDATGLTGTASYSLAVAATVPGAPVIGLASAGDGQATVSFNAPLLNGGETITGYTVSGNAGAVTATGTSSPITVSGLANGTSYSFTVTARNSVGAGTASSASNPVTPRAGQTITFANPGAQDYGTTPNLAASASSGLAVSYVSGTASVCSVTSGGAVSFASAGTCTIAASQAGDATYLAATSVSQSFTVRPVVPGAPVIGVATAGDGEATVAFSAPLSNGGEAISGYTVSTGSGAVTASGTSSPIKVSGLANGTAYTFTVTAKNSAGAGAASAPSNAVTPVAALLAPAANAVTATVAANSTGNTLAPVLTGGTATAIAIATGPAHGTAAISDLSISYTPAAGYSGTDSLTYTASNSAGTSVAATIAITVTAPSLALSPASGALSAATVGKAYSASVGAGNGTAPYSYKIGSGALAAGLSLDAASGAISGTPTAAGSVSFTLLVTDALGATGTANYTITVSAAASLTFSPAGGALKEGMAGEAYSQQITASGGGGGAGLVYSLASGSLPKGMVLNVSTGELTGPLAASTEGDYAFAISARDTAGTTASASYSLKVAARAVVVADQVVEVASGATPNNVYLNRNATGGPFTEADIVAVEPPEAGTATIVQGELAALSTAATPVGWYLQFTPNSSYSGEAKVNFRLTSSLGRSNTGTITYKLSYDADEVAADIDGLVRSFVQARQSMISSAIKVPGLMERRQMGAATEPVTTSVSPSANGLTLGFSTSLQQMQAARDHADGAAANGVQSPFNLWIDGAFLAHNREENGDKWGSFAMLNLGVDYLLSQKALVGLSFHYDRMTDPTEEDAELTGNGWLAGPNASLEIAKGVFWDTSLLYGGSANDIDTALWDGSFETSRWMADTALKGQFNLDRTTVVTPKLRAVYFSERVEDYAVTNGSGDRVDLNGFTEEQLRVSLGADIARQFVLDDGARLTPKLGVTGGFSGLDGSGAFASVNAGLTLATAQGISIETGLLFNIEGDGEKSVGARVGISGRF